MTSHSPTASPVIPVADPRPRNQHTTVTDSIIKLTATDFEEANAHLSLVFNDPNFAELVPALYEPTDRHMSCNLAVRRGGRIAAIVGVFPIEWNVGDTRLKLAGIGGVSVHPDFRGQGLMRLLMDAAMEEIEQARYHAACLGGNRRRYGHWGFEKAGLEAAFVVTPNSLEHSGPSTHAIENGTFHIAPASASDFSAMHALYRRLPIHCTRSSESFHRHLLNWRRQPLVLRTSDNLVAGYACFDPKDASCVECSFESDVALQSFLSIQTAAVGRPLRIFVPLIRDQKFERLEALSDDASLIECSNWRIYDWPAVVGALLKVKHSFTSLVPGSCVIRVTAAPRLGDRAAGRSVTFRIVVDTKVSCELCDNPPDFEADGASLLRALASPLPPDLPRSASHLAQWRPLPLMIPMQDRI